MGNLPSAFFEYGSIDSMMIDELITAVLDIMVSFEMFHFPFMLVRVFSIVLSPIGVLNSDNLYHTDLKKN